MTEAFFVCETFQAKSYVKLTCHSLTYISISIVYSIDKRYDSRLSNFDNWMPGALERYNSDGGYRCQRIRNEMKLARQHAAALASKREKELWRINA